MAKRKTPDQTPSSAPSGRLRCVILAPVLLPAHESGQISGWVIGRVVKPILESLPFAFLVDAPAPATARISGQSVSLIARADLVVADLTGHPPDVFYHLAAAHALQKRVIHLILKGQSLPFDHKEFRTLFYDMNWVADLPQAEQTFREYLTCVLADEVPPLNPVASARTWRMLERSKDPRNDAISALSQQIAELAAKVERLEQNITSPLPNADALNRSVDIAINEWEHELEAMKRLRKSLESDQISDTMEKLRHYDETARHCFPAPPLRI